MSSLLPAAPRFTRAETRVVICGVILGMFLASLDQTIIAAALPTIGQEFGALSHIGWIVTAYLVTSTAAAPIYGKLSDIHGRRRMLQLAMLIFVGTSLLCGLATSLPELILFRALQGIGGGGLISMAHATIADVVAPRDRGTWQGYISGAFAASNVLGPVLGGIIAERIGWAWIFWINLPIGLFAIGVVHVALAKLVTRPTEHRIDWIGAVLLLLAVTSTLLVTSSVTSGLIPDDGAILLLAGGALLLWAAFIWRQLRAAEPILSPRLFQNRVYRRAIGGTFLASMTMTGAIVFIPLYLQLVIGVTVEGAGLLLIPATLGTVAGSLISGMLISRTGRYKKFPLMGSAIATFGCVLLSFDIGPLSPGLIATLLGLLGVGIGLTFPTVLVAIQNAVDRQDMGAATASVSFFRSLGGSLGVALLGAVLAHTFSVPNGFGAETGGVLVALPPALLRDAAVGFQNLFLTAALIAAAAFVVALILPELPLRQAQPEPGTALE